MGGGLECKAIMEMIFAEKLSQLRMELIGVASTDPEDVGYQYAREHGIYTTRDYRDLFKFEDLDIIIELTGRDEVANEIAATKQDHVRLIDHVVARLFRDILRLEEECLQEHKRADNKLNKTQLERATLSEQAREREDLQEWINTFETFVGRFTLNGIMLFCNESSFRVTGMCKEALFGKYFPDTELWAHSKRERSRVVECFERCCQSQ